MVPSSIAKKSPRPRPSPPKAPLGKIYSHDGYASDGDSGPESLKFEFHKLIDDDLQTDDDPIVEAKSDKSSGSSQEPEADHLKQKVKALKLENKHLKDRQLCRNCRVKAVSVTLLPCGHYAFCYDCGQSFTSCPICRKTILADVRTYLA